MSRITLLSLDGPRRALICLYSLGGIGTSQEVAARYYTLFGKTFPAATIGQWLRRLAENTPPIVDCPANRHKNAAWKISVEGRQLVHTKNLLKEIDNAQHQPHQPDPASASASAPQPEHTPDSEGG